MVDSLWIFLGMEISLCGCLCNELLQGLLENMNILKKETITIIRIRQRKKMKREEIMKEKRKKINWTKRKGYDSYSKVLLFDVHK